VNAHGSSVLIADDHEQVRLQTRDILIEGGFEVVALANDGPSAVKEAIEHQPAVCLLDINMPGDGIETAREINRVVPTSTVVMLTVSRDENHLFDALRAGARGYLLKGTDPSEMVAALRNVLEGEPALSPGLAMRIIEQFRGDRSRRVYVRDRQAVELSPREAEVLELMRQGLRTDQIAQRMYVAPVTVRTHVRAVLKKLNANDRDAALRMFDDSPER
jgi:DNA-binding NarL/FixJ family response regulator